MSNIYLGKMEIESIFSNDDKHRFVLRRRYSTTRKDKSNQKIVFILINPSYSDELLFDKTNRLASNIGVKDGYDEVVILNLFSLITKDKPALIKNLNIANHIENDQHIVDEVTNADRVIISWGIDYKFIDRILDVKQLIKNTGIEASKVYSITYTDKNGKVYNPAHLSMYITDNPPNFQQENYDLN